MNVREHVQQEYRTTGVSVSFLGTEAATADFQEDVLFPAKSVKHTTLTDIN